MAFEPDKWADGAAGGTPITAAELNRIEAAGVAASAAPSWASVTGKPSTFAPTIGTTGTTAKAGNYQPTIAQVTGLQAALDALSARLDDLEEPPEG